MKCSSCSAPVRPVIAVDIDGTLGDYHGHFVNFASQYLDMQLPVSYDGSGEFSEYLGLDKRTYRDVKLAYRQGGMKRFMPIYGGAAWFVNRLGRAGAEIWIATTRPYLRLDNIDPDTRFWLQRHGIGFDGMLYDEHKYNMLMGLVEKERIVAVVEDLTDLCQDAERLGLQAWQPRRSHNKGNRHNRSFHDFVGLASVLLERMGEWNGNS